MPAGTAESACGIDVCGAFDDEEGEGRREGVGERSDQPADRAASFRMPYFRSSSSSLRSLFARSQVDAISETLQQRCGSFCSTDDVLLYKAIESMRRARDSYDASERTESLRESLRFVL
jgi:hypothetical protein